ncbi:V-type proton ATPase 16 kDa proteolipid [Datura stramonium]|uniref:V-type proton ATPase proteolipid subunit n=1 Tax=Datura stramonium TaxID=4076 RepID=A0ABS8V6E6_DATST|nr:V-type proton ATPase 16 kDa proteolipid [Datura stramonium]
MTSTFSGDETAPFFGFLGAAAALVFSCMGAAYGTAKSGVGVASMGVMRPELVMKSIVPVVMAGVLGIYGLIIAVIISTGINPKTKSYYLFDGYAHLSSGLACGLAGLSAGMAIGIVGDAGVRCFDGNLIKNTEGYVLRRPITRGQQRMKACRMQICKPARKKINEDFNGKGYS